MFNYSVEDRKVRKGREQIAHTWVAVSIRPGPGTF